VKKTVRTKYNIPHVGKIPGNDATCDDVNGASSYCVPPMSLYKMQALF